MKREDEELSLENKRVQTVIAMVKQRAPLREIGTATSVSHETVRNLIKKIAQEHGKEVFESSKPFWTVAEAADEIGVDPTAIRRICSQDKISYQRRSNQQKSTYLIDEVGMKTLRERFSGRCSICRQESVNKKGYRHQVCSNAACIRERYRRSRTNMLEKEVSLESLRGWRKDLWERLQDRLLPEDEEWIDRHEAIARSGLSKMQVSWLQLRSIVTTHPHLEKKWRGKPITLYAASEIEIARQVFQTHKDHENKAEM